MDLTRVNGCYSKELREMCCHIKTCLKAPSVSVGEMKQFVLDIVEPAFINAGAKQNFKNDIMACETKEAIDKRCQDAVRSGMFYSPRKRRVSA